MSRELLYLGNENFIPVDSIIIITTFKPASVRKLVEQNKLEGKHIDLSMNKKTRSVIVTQHYTYESSIKPDTLAKRIMSDEIENIEAIDEEG